MARNADDKITLADEVTIDPDNGVALMRNLGVTLTETADLEQLAAGCAEDGQSEFLHVAAPLEVAKGSGSPLNPVVIKWSRTGGQARMTTYDDRRGWRSTATSSPDCEIELDNALDILRAGLAADPDGVAIASFDGVLSRSELDATSDAQASALLTHGFTRGDRLAVCLPNVPQFVEGRRGDGLHQPDEPRPRAVVPARGLRGHGAGRLGAAVRRGRPSRATRCGPARSRTSSPSTPRCASRPSSGA